MMDYIKILCRILKVETMENVYCGFVDKLKEHTVLNIISTDEFEEIISFLAKEQPTEYQVDKKDFSTYYYFEETILTRNDMNKYQNKVCYVEDYDDGDFQILVSECGGDLEVWFTPLFFKEFYTYCVEVLDGIEPSPSAEKIKEKEDEEKMNISVNDFCDIVAKDLLNDRDMLNSLIENMINLGASDDQIIKTISMILRNRFED